MDDAFPSGMMDTLIKDPPGESVADPDLPCGQGKMMAADLKKLTSAETLHEGPLSIYVSNSITT